MKTGNFLYGVLAAAVVLALEAPPISARDPPGGVNHSKIVYPRAPDSTKTASEVWEEKIIAHDKVKPFVQPEPVSISHKAAVKFKPQLHISQGCHPYPAVNAQGENSARIQGTEYAEGKCNGSTFGSQVYGRSSWHRTVWVMVYTWYIPDDIINVSRLEWEHVVVWLDNPGVANPKLLAVSLWNIKTGQYTKLVPPKPEFMDGASVKLKYGPDNGRYKLTFTSTGGEFQPLIMWDQLTENARRTLNGMWTPPSDSRYTEILADAWPFGPSV